MESTQQGGQVSRQNDEPDHQAGGQWYVLLPEIRECDNRTEAGHAETRARKQVGKAVTEAVTEGQPQVDRVERNAERPDKIHAPGKRPGIRDNTDDTTGQRFLRVGNDPSEQQYGRTEEREPEDHRSRRGVLATACPAEINEVQQHCRADDEAQNRLLVLFSRALAQPIP